MLQVGIVGLPNVGKSTLFNALTRSHKAEAANYPFCTIEPNVGIVTVPDKRLEPLRAIANTQTVIPAAIEFVDIAGLVAGASKGEGLGNKFLSHIREVDAIVHLVRCFEDSDIVHSVGNLDPLRDIDIINTELLLADLESVEGQLHKMQKRAKGQDKEALQALPLLEKAYAGLSEGKAAKILGWTADELPIVKRFGLLSLKPMLYVCNVAEHELAQASEHPRVQQVAAFAQKHFDAGCCTISAGVEAGLLEFSPEETAEYLHSLGVQESGVLGLIESSYKLLGLASYFTAGEKEVRAWTFTHGMKAPQCAGVIHTDFEKGFIKAEIVSYKDLLQAGSIAKAREAGRYRLEGKEYVFQDGDVALFRFA